MWGKKRMVKDVKGIENLGGMKMVCREKRGRVSEEEMVLEGEVKVDGREEKENGMVGEGYLKRYLERGVKKVMEGGMVWE